MSLKHGATFIKSTQQLSHNDFTSVRLPFRRKGSEETVLVSKRYSLSEFVTFEHMMYTVRGNSLALWTFGYSNIGNELIHRVNRSNILASFSTRYIALSPNSINVKGTFIDHPVKGAVNYHPLWVHYFHPVNGLFDHASLRSWSIISNVQITPPLRS